MTTATSTSPKASPVRSSTSSCETSASSVVDVNAKLQSFDRLHQEGFAYLADNSYIHSGYRLNYSVRDCFLSLFELHNETLNVWTHMVGSILFVSLMGYFMVSNSMLARSTSFSPILPERAAPWCELPATPVLTDGRHTNKLFFQTCMPEACPQAQGLARSSTKQKYYEIASIIFEHSLHQIPSLERFHHLLEDHVEGISHTVAAQMATIQTEVSVLRERLGNATDGAQVVILKEQLHHRVERFSSFLQGITMDVGADLPIQYALQELHGLTDSVKNGIQIMSQVDTHHVPHWPIFVFMISAVICLTCSATFHLLFVYSKPMYFILSRLDYAGITVMIAGSFYPLIYYSFYCHPWILRTYLTAISVLAGITFVISLVPAFGTSKYLMLRTGIFLSLGFFGVIPMGHLIWQFGLFDPHVTVMLGPLLLMAALYVVGATIYATRFPERFYPGRFDVWFSSHQLWHMCVVAAALVHLLNALQHYEWRWNTYCEV